MQAALANNKETNNDVSATDAMLVYEVGYHLLPMLEESEIDPTVSRFRDVLSKAGGTFIAEGAPQKITLAYPMAVWSNGTWVKYREAYFGWLKFEVGSSAIAGIEQSFKEDTSVIRFLLVKTVREDTRANVRQFVLKEVKRGDSIKSTIKKAPSVESKGEKVSDQKLDEVLEELTAE